MLKQWIIQPPWDRCREASTRWNVHPLVAQLLFNRGVDMDGDPKAFLSPRMDELHRPECIPGATKAADLLAEAVEKRRRIVIYGDYDVDGITGTAILWKVLRQAGADVRYYVPHRLDEGYGLNLEAVQKLASDGAQLLVSVDCGVTAVDEVAAARAAGLQVIITDHHQPGDQLPDADALMHPGVGEGSPNPALCGSGVAFKLAWAMAQKLSGGQRVSAAFRELLLECLSLAALGTIADVVPLTDENRILARYGLEMLPGTKQPGLAALIESAGLSGQKIGDYEVGFRLAPRLNAAGRMGHALLAVELLTRADASRAKEIAMYLEEHNRARQGIERRIVKQACEMAEAAGMNGDRSRGIVLASEGWHAGVIGIVAARLVDRYRRPTVLISLSNGVGQGSARSVTHFQMHEALTCCRDHLISFGGHAMAAGLKIEPGNVDAFADAFIEQANQRLTGADLHAKLRLDTVVSLKDLDMPTVQKVRGLGPFGIGNPKPRFATDWVDLAAEPRCVGKAGDHLQVTVRDNGTTMRGIAFGLAGAAEDLKQHRRCKIAFEPTINEFKGRTSVEMQVLDFAFPE